MFSITQPRSRRWFLTTAGLATCLPFGLIAAVPARADDTIKVGILPVSYTHLDVYKRQV